jgi:uncharacterized protein
MWNNLLVAVALVLVIEGILPFLSPKLWRKMFMHLLQQSDMVLHVMGLSAMLLGVLLLFLIHMGWL